MCLSYNSCSSRVAKATSCISFLVRHKTYLEIHLLIKNERILLIVHFSSVEKSSSVIRDNPRTQWIIFHIFLVNFIFERGVHSI